MAELQIIITGENQSGAAFDSLKKDAGEVKEGLEGATKTGSGFFSNLLSTAGGFLAANVLGSIAGQLTSFVSDGVAAAQDTAKLMAATETIIKNTGGAAGVSAEQVASLASSLSDAAGKSLFGDDQIQGATNVLLKYKELKGIIPGVTTLSVDMAAALGKDPAAAAEFLGRALQKPFDATAKLAKEGIVLTEAQKATLESFKATGDEAGAQAFLMEQLNSTYAGSAEAQAKAAGGMVQFKARMGEVGESIGASLLPLLNRAGSVLSDTLAPAIESVAAWLGEALPQAIDAVAPLFDMIGGVLAGMAANWDATADMGLNFGESLAFVLDRLLGFGEGAETITPIFEQLEDIWANVVIPTIQQMADYFTTVLVPALQQVWAFIQENVIPILGMLVDVAFAILKEDIRILAALWVNVLWPALQKVWAFISENVIPILADAVVWIKNNLPPAIKFLADLWNNTLLPALKQTWEFISTKVIPILEAIGTVINAVLGVAFKFIVGVIVTTVIPALTTMGEYISKNVLPVLASIGESIMKVAGPAFTWLGGQISPLIAFFTSLGSSISGVIEWLQNLAAAISSIDIPDWAGGGSDPPPGNAVGTKNFRGGMTMVGEFGPELVSLPKGSQISTASDTKSMLGGGDTYVFNFADSVGSYDRSRLESETRRAMDGAGDRAFNRIRTGG